MKALWVSSRKCKLKASKIPPIIIKMANLSFQKYNTKYFWGYEITEIFILFWWEYELVLQVCKSLS